MLSPRCTRVLIFTPLDGSQVARTLLHTVQYSYWYRRRSSGFDKSFVSSKTSSLQPLILLAYRTDIVHFTRQSILEE